MVTKRFKLISALLLTLLSSSVYSASNKPKSLWQNKLSLSGTAGWDFNQEFIGTTEGNALDIGGAIHNSTQFTQDKHEWNLNISLLETWQKSADADYWNKSGDNFELKTDYLYNLNSWTGFIASVSLNMPILPNINHQSEKYDYMFAQKSLSNTTDFTLTQAFQPLTLEQSAGWFLRMLNKDAIKWRVEVNAMAREIFAKGQYNILSSDAEKKEISLKEFDNFVQFGPSIGTYAQGTFFNKYLSYQVDAELFMALVSKTKASIFNVDIASTVAFNFSKYISLDWEFKALLVPELQEKFQIQSNLLLSFNYEY